MAEQSVRIHVVLPDQAPHTFGEQPEQAIVAYLDGMKPVEVPEPCLVSDPGAPRVPSADRGLASRQAQQEPPPPPEDIDPEMTIAWGEDPGWTTPETLHVRPEPEKVH